MISRGNPAKASKQLGWQAHNVMGDAIRLMVAAEAYGTDKTAKGLLC